MQLTSIAKTGFKATDHFYEIVTLFNFTEIRKMTHQYSLYFCLQATHLWVREIQLATCYNLMLQDVDISSIDRSF